MTASPLVDRLANLIAQRALVPGQKLPSERTLATEFGVSRSSLREAIGVLTSRGVLVARHGGGTFLAEDEHAALTDPIADALQTLATSKSYLREFIPSLITKHPILSIDSSTVVFPAISRGLSFCPPTT